MAALTNNYLIFHFLNSTLCKDGLCKLKDSDGDGGGRQGKWKMDNFEKVHKGTESFTPNFPIEISEGRGSYLQLVIVPCVEMERFHLLDWNKPKRLVLNFESVELIYSSWTKRHDGICKNSVWLYCDGGSSSIRLQKICVGEIIEDDSSATLLVQCNRHSRKKPKDWRSLTDVSRLCWQKKTNISNEYRKGQLSVRNSFLLLLPVKRKFFLSTVTKVLSDS